MKASIRDLYFRILELKAKQYHESVLKSWIIENDYKHYLSCISDKLQMNRANFSEEDIWELYALTRVLDVLTLGLQPDNEADSSNLPDLQISISEYIEFNNLIGLNTITPKSFNTFECEIIEAKEGKDNFQINEIIFPAVMLKNLMIKRAGVKILLDPQEYNLTLINNAPIYFAFMRKNRQCFDLSKGWGSNSQWRTDLRLDIETDNSFIYNQNGTISLNNPTDEQLDKLKEQNLEIEEAIELTRFRHFISSTKDDLDLFPYDFKYEEKKNSK